MDLNEVAVFIEVIKAGSFTQAARKLGMPISTVSHRISALEERLGVTLIKRTTRKLSVTPAGDAYFKRCLEGLEQIQAAEAELAATHHEPQGLLRLTAPVELGSSILPSIIGEFTTTYPKVQIEVLLTDRRIDLLTEGVDLALRAGEMKDSSLIAKKLGAVYFGLFASPTYLKAHRTPHTPEALLDHSCIQFTPLGRETWKLQGPSGFQEIPVPGRILLNDLNAVKALAVDSRGIALLPTFYCRAEQRTRGLVRLLPEWQSDASPVHFVYPAQKFVLPKLSAFIAMGSGKVRESLEA